MWNNQAPTSLVFPPGATTGKRITIDKNGILGYNDAGNLIFAFTNQPPASLPRLDLTSPFVITTDNVGLFGGKAVVNKGPNFSANGSYSISANETFDAQVGTGFLGHPYYSEKTPSAQSIANGVVTILTNLTDVANFNNGEISSDTSDSGQWNNTTGVFTANGSGMYTLSLCIAYGAFVSGARHYMEIVGATTGQIAQNDMICGGGGVATMTVLRFLTTGEAYTFRVYQNTGVAKSIIPAQSYLSIKREIY